VLKEKGQPPCNSFKLHADTCGVLGVGREADAHVYWPCGGYKATAP
jgi:hypothetical protein